MNFKLIFSFVCIVLLLGVACVSAQDVNVNSNLTTDDPPIDSNVAEISINSTQIYTGQSVDINFKDTNGTPISNRNLTAKINNEKHLLTTDSQGSASLKLDLKASSYVLNVVFEGDETYSPTNQTFNIHILKQNVKLSSTPSSLIKGEHFFVYLTNQFNQPVTDVSVSFKVNGKTYSSTTNSNGRAGFKINLNPHMYSIDINFKGNAFYNSVSKTVKLLVPETTSLEIGNVRLLSNGYLRIYLKSPSQSVLSKKTIVITVGNKKFTRTTNSEGIIVFKPYAGKGKFTVTATYKGTSTIVGSEASKTVIGVRGNVRDPLKYKIPFKNGLPDLDLMPGNYVLANGDLKYTVTKAQYMGVIKRDSHCLFLFNKLSKFTFFKSKAEPKLNHVIQREKWNVIERTINTLIVKKNQKGYWPSQVTVSLKGKSYTYSEVRDKQNTEYTCAPTSASMCSQVLRNYISEKQFARQAGTQSGFGTKCQWIKSALEINHFKCIYFTKKSWNTALNHLKRGGCALIFHANNHYVSILDISKDGKKVLVSNSYGRYASPDAKLPNKWLNVNYVKTRFCSYDQRSLIVKLKYSLNTPTKKKLTNFYSSMGAKWTRQNTDERILDIGY